MVDFSLEEYEEKQGIFIQRVCDLCDMRGITGDGTSGAKNIAISDCKDILASYLWTHGNAIFDNGEAHSLLDLLENDKYLTDNVIMAENFRKKFEELISEPLINHPLFLLVFSLICRRTGKGIGIGEVALPLIIRDCKFSNKSDNYLNGKDKQEIGNGTGKCLKTSNDTKDFKVNYLQQGWSSIQILKKWFNGNHLIANWPNEIEKSSYSPYEIFDGFINEMYPISDDKFKKDLRDYLVKDENYKDHKKIALGFGLFGLREYKRKDDWNNIILLHEEFQEMVNITRLDDISDISDLNLSFSPHFKKGTDSNGLSEGYIIIRMLKNKKVR